MRKTDFSGNAASRQSFSERAETRSRPNGFSTITRPRSARPTADSPSTTDGKHRRRDRQVEHGQRTFGELLGQRLVERRVAVVADLHGQVLGHVGEGALVHAAVGGALDGVARVIAQLVVVPGRAGHPDHGHAEAAGDAHLVDRREQLLAGKVAGGAEQHHRVGPPATAVARRHDRRGTVNHVLSPVCHLARPPGLGSHRRGADRSSSSKCSLRPRRPARRPSASNEVVVSNALAPAIILLVILAGTRAQGQPPRARRARTRRPATRASTTTAALRCPSGATCQAVRPSSRDGASTTRAAGSPPATIEPRATPPAGRRRRGRAPRPRRRRARRR